MSVAEAPPYLLADLLRVVVQAGASDLHLTSGVPPCLRVHGDLRPFDRLPTLDADAVGRLVLDALPAADVARFELEGELDTAISVPGVARFRVNVFRQQEAVGAVLRAIPFQVVPFEQLGLPASVLRCTELHRGLVLVTGPTGSGKSTTLASLVDRVNASRPVHIVTIEDPIEFLHTSKRAIVNQREVGRDTASFARALKAVLRQDPDVILVGELRDLETVQAALTAAETGHLVFATLHTQDAPQAVDRVIDVFPAHQQAQVRVQLALTLQAVVSQQLVPRADGRGRAVAVEVLTVTPALRNHIREGKTHQIPSAMQTGAAQGMQTMDAALATLVKDGIVTRELALDRAHTPDELARTLGGPAVRRG